MAEGVDAGGGEGDGRNTQDTKGEKGERGRVRRAEENNGSRDG